MCPLRKTFTHLFSEFPSTTGTVLDESGFDLVGTKVTRDKPLQPESRAARIEGRISWHTAKRHAAQGLPRAFPGLD
eukprot:1157573-Pelagomonas_calceolata.AAC.4